MIELLELYQVYILPESTHALNQLILYLKRNKSLSIQIGSDSEVSDLQLLNKGNNNMNAHVAYDYLIANDIDPSRVYFNPFILNHRPCYKIIRSEDVIEDFSNDPDEKKAIDLLFKVKDILMRTKFKIFRRFAPRHE